MEFTLWTGDLRPFVLKECARANCSPHFQLEEIKGHGELIDRMMKNSVPKYTPGSR